MNHLTNFNSPKELRFFLEKRGLGMRKKFGQNFLVNPAARKELLDALELKGAENVWEIGPGLGAMTTGLLERGARLTAFEIDKGFIAFLREYFDGNPFFTLVEGDVLKTWPKHRPDNKEELFMLGNLPYNIAAILLADFIEKGCLFRRIVVTVQREVAQRMAAGPGTKDYSSFSVLCASVYKVKLLSVIKASSFYPAPRVDSQGVRLELKTNQDKLPKLFYPLVRCLFSSRRKTIRNTLTGFASSVIIKPAHSARELAEDVLQNTGLCGNRRPETLEIDEFAALAAYFEGIVGHEHGNSSQT